MKKKFLVVIIMIIVFIFGLTIGLFLNKTMNNKAIVNENNISIYDIEPIVKEYININDRKVYLYNINEVRINNDKEEITLKDYIKNYNDLDEFFQNIDNYIEVKNILKDGGTTIYITKTDNELFNSDMTIIKCNTEDGNRDVYFGMYMNTTKAFKNGVCGKNFFEDIKFNRTYTLESIKEVDLPDNIDSNTLGSNHYVELIIKDENDNKVKIERVMSDESLKLMKNGKEYLFYFENKYGELIKEDINYIFENCTLTGVVPK